MLPRPDVSRPRPCQAGKRDASYCVLVLEEYPNGIYTVSQLPIFITEKTKLMSND